MISVCIITKNEKEKLKRCLQSLVNSGLEIVVVDTGSTDATKIMAYEYTPNIYDYVWKDDFANARNYAASKATGEYVLAIDSDEWISEVDWKSVEKTIKNNTKMGKKPVYAIHRTNLYQRKDERCEDREWISRLYDRNKYHFVGRIHEQIVPIEYKAYMNVNTPENIDINILHDGYDGDNEKVKEKANRNKRLLLVELGKNSEDPYILYQIGKACYMGGEYKEAASYFDKALFFDLNPRLTYVSDMVETYGYALVFSKEPEKAMGLASVEEEFGYSADFLFMMGYVYMNNREYQRAIDEFIKASTMPDDAAKRRGVNSYLAFYNIGVIYECLGEIDKAAIYYKKAGTYEKAKERLKAISR